LIIFSLVVILILSKPGENMTTKVLIIYATDYGNTKKMAEAIEAGVLSVTDVQCVVKTAEDAQAADFTASDAIIVGTPVHMGSPDWRIKKMIDTVCSGLWMKNTLNGKVGGVFATGGGYGNAGGGCEVSMLALLNNFAELGLIMVPLPKNTPGYNHGGLQWGPYARSSGINMEQTGISKDSLEVAFHHGANIARLATILKGKEFFVNSEAAVARS
jgi:NAD(P)H dehydrogenase (quinone)